MNTTRVVAILVGLGALVPLAMRGVRPELLVGIGIIGIGLGARIARDHRRLTPDANATLLGRRALRGLLLALPFLIVTVVTARGDAGAGTAEDAFTRIAVIVPCSLLAAWFVSGAIAPGSAWLRTRRSRDHDPR